jgi:cytochrome c biogenesis protein CcmG, thiol:disulfide interchange protein DsbE
MGCTMRSELRIGTLVVGAILLVGAFLAVNGHLSQPAPDFSLPEVDGTQVDLQSYRGRPVLLVFWTASCSICQHELPLLSQLEPDFRNNHISILAIHVGAEDEAREYMSANGIRLTSLSDSQGTVARAYHVGGVPKLVLIDADGRISRTASGWTNEQTLTGWMHAFRG